MFKKTKVCSSILLAFGGSLTLAAAPVMAQQQLDRVEITGSSIKRINSESALPVTVITAEEIKKSGYTTASDLIQSLPAMQGFLTSSQSVNGGGGGVTNASLHSIGAPYTLVLLNGRRVAPYNTGTSVNLNSLPLSAVDRIEVLTDGASAIYGADAIAGVVNFILKKNSTEGELIASANIPQHAGGKSANFSLTKGFGDLDKDRFNVLATFSYDKQKSLMASQRDFSKTGFKDFTDAQGRHLSTFFSSSNSVPGTVFLNSPNLGDPNHKPDPEYPYGDPTNDPNFTQINGDSSAGGAAYTPYQLKTGTCPAKTVFRGGFCRFDFSSTVEAIPESDRATLFTSGRLKISEAATVFGEVLYSSFKNKPMYAPPAQPGIFLTQALYDAHVAPYLTQLGLTPAQVIQVGQTGGVADPSQTHFNGPVMNLRLYDAGGRQDEYKTDTLHVVVGGEGSAVGWDLSGYLTHSQNKQTDTAMSGYASANKFQAIVDSGAFDPLDAQIGTSQAVLAPAVLHQVLDSTKSSIDVVSGRASRPFMQLKGGDASVGFGTEIGQQRYTDDPSAISMGQNSLQPTFTDSIIGGSGGALPFDSKRKTVGLFTELILPLTKEFELSGALRYDRVGATTNSQNFDVNGNLISPATQGKTSAATTYKVSARFQPQSDLLFRGSYGTGFKAPTLRDITFPVQAFGNTGFHDCPTGLNVATYRCKSSPSEYNIRQGGNPNSDDTALRPEKSQQWTVGFRVEPSPEFTLGVDLWNVALKDRIDVVPEDTAFDHGSTYASSFSVQPDPITGAPTLTFTQAPLNLGKARYQGLDFDIGSHVATSVGRLSGRATVTYMIRSDYEITGQAGYQSSLGKVGPDTEVTFRWLANFTASLETGAFTNTFNLAIKPGYHDQVATTTSGPEVRLVNANGTYGARVNLARDVKPYALLDWQGKYAVNKAFAITLGIKNIADASPPLSVQDLSGTGNARGYDGRYTDPLGRTFYMTGSYKF